MYSDVIMTGFGGQGIQTISQVVIVAAINKGLEVTYLPSYGVEKRGGRTDVTVVVSDEEIGSPITNTPLSLIAMDTIGLEFYQTQLIPDGLLIANTSLIPESMIIRDDVTVIKVRCNDEANAIGNSMLANMVTLGCFVEKVPFLNYADIEAAILDVIPERLADTIPDNLSAIHRGIEIAKN